MASKAIAGLVGQAPRSSGQWILLILAAGLPAAGYLAAGYYDRRPDPGIDFRPQLAFAAAWILAAALTIAGMWRRVRWALPAFALNLILAISGLLAPRFLKPDVVVWGDRDVHHFSMLPDGSLLVCGAEWVRLSPDATFARSLGESCGFVDVVEPFADGRVVLGLYGRPMFGDRNGQFRDVESLPPGLRVVRGATATADGGTLLATVSASGGGLNFWKYSAGERLERSWVVEPPEANWSGTPLGWSVVVFADGSAGVLWRDSVKLETTLLAWHGSDGRVRPETVKSVCSLCIDPQLMASRDGPVYVYGNSNTEVSLHRFRRPGEQDAAFRPDLKALRDVLENIQSLVELPRGGLLVGGKKRVLRLDDKGKVDEFFNCQTEHGVSRMALQGGRLLLLDGDRLRRFHLDGTPDDSFRMPRLSTRMGSPPRTKPL